MMTLEKLKAAVTAAEQQLAAAHRAVDEFTERPENNVFATLEEAENVLRKQMRARAAKDCECAGECGLEQYTQGFMVNGRKYLAIAQVEYDRHDKTYYYVDSFDFSVAEVPA